MNEILQKQTEEAAREFNQKEGIPYALIGHTFNAFMEGAAFALHNQWISVEEALPEVNELVFGCVNDEGTPQAVGMAYYDEYNGWHYSDEEEISLITHWMYIPSLKGGEK